MLPLYFLILLTTCYGDGVKSSITDGGRLPGMVQPDVNETTDYNNRSMIIEAGRAFRKYLSEISIPVALNLTNSDLSPISNTSLMDLQNDNSTQQQLLRNRNRHKLERIQRIRDCIFQATWHNRTRNSSERTPRETDEFFRSIPREDKSIDDFIKTLIRQSSTIAGHLSDVVIYRTVNPSEVEKLEVPFSELGLDDVIIAPEGVRWPVCNGVEDVHTEILRKMTNIEYPLPLRVHAKIMMDEFQMEAHLRELKKTSKMAIRPFPTQPLILLENEDIKFVEDDFSSSSSEKNPSSGLLKIKPLESNIDIQAKQESSDVISQSKAEGNLALYTEITVIPSEPDIQSSNEKPMENLKPPATQDFPSSPSSSMRSNRSSGFILNILNRSPKFKRKARHDYEIVSGKDEDSTYSNISTISTRADAGASSRKYMEGKKSDPKVEGDEQILEALRQVVRKCTNPDPMKRPSSKDLFDLVEIAYDKS